MMLAETDIASLRAANESVMGDSCKIATPEATADEAGQLIADVVEWDEIEATVVCGLRLKALQMIDRMTGTPVRTDGVVRVPHGTSVAVGDRLLVSSRLGGGGGAGIEFEVVDGPREGPAGIVVDVRRWQP